MLGPNWLSFLYLYVFRELSEIKIGIYWLFGWPTIVEKWFFNSIIILKCKYKSTRLISESKISYVHLQFDHNFFEDLFFEDIHTLQIIYEDNRTAQQKKKWVQKNEHDKETFLLFINSSFCDIQKKKFFISKD